MYETLTLEECEAVRGALGLTAQDFSLRLGYSKRAYPNAVERRKISRWMRREIARRYGRVLSTLR
jgi:RNase P protein component